MTDDLGYSPEMDRELIAEQAARIHELEAENARLRNALSSIVNTTLRRDLPASEVREIARAALKGE